MQARDLRRVLNDARSLERAIDGLRDERFGQLGDDELVEVEPGVWARPEGAPGASGVQRALGRVDGVLGAIERFARRVQRRHAYGAARRSR